MGGRVGPLTMTAPLLKIWVHPKGLIVRAILGNEHAILAAEVVHLGKRRVFFQEAVEIEHLGMGSRSPLVLYRSIDDPIVSAIRRVIAAEAAAPVPVTNEEAAPAPPSVEPAPIPADAGLAERRGQAGSLPLATAWLADLQRHAGPPRAGDPGIHPRLSTVLEVAGLAVGSRPPDHGRRLRDSEARPVRRHLDDRRRGDPGLQRAAVHAPTLRVGHPLDVDSADPQTPARIIRATTKNHSAVRIATSSAASIHGAGASQPASSAIAAPRRAPRRAAGRRPRAARRPRASAR